MLTLRTGGLAIALGVGFAIAAGHGTAQADTTSSDSSSAGQYSQQNRGTGAKAKPAATAARNAAGLRSVASAAAAPQAPSKPAAPSPLEAMLALARRESATLPAPTGIGPHRAKPAPQFAPPSPQAADVVEAEPGYPDPDAQTPTQYGDIGNWMLQADGEIADWIGQKYDNKSLLEGINVIIVDPFTGPEKKAVLRMRRAMTTAGFPGVIFHTNDYNGLINDIDYQAQPMGWKIAFSNAFFLLPNSHGRMFGPYPPSGDQGYTWIVAMSKEELGETSEGSISHVFVSFNEARDALVEGMVSHGLATSLDPVYLGNNLAADNPNYTTKDADGWAAVIQFNL